VSFVGPSHLREWTAVMVGDVVRDGTGAPWRVVRIAHRPGVRPGDGAVMCWVELWGGVPASARTMRVPDARARVEMSEGPGYGIHASGSDALAWAAGTIADTMGGTVVDT
jgi:lysozyme family protein